MEIQNITADERINERLNITIQTEGVFSKLKEGLNRKDLGIEA